MTIGMVRSMLRSRSLIIMAVVSAVLLLGLAGGCQPSAMQIISGTLYSDTITTSDTRDGMLRAHVYSLDVAANDAYTIECQSLSGASIQVWECNGREAWILETYDTGNQAVNWTFDSAGKKEIWVEAFEEELPAEYNLRITKIEF